MALRDQPMRCGACGYRFVYTVREQRQRAEAGLWESGTLLFCPRCKSADVQSVASSQLVEHETRPHPAADARPEPAPRGAGGAPVERRAGRGDDRGRGRFDRDARPARRDDGGAPRGGHAPGRGRGAGRRPERRLPRQTELRVRHVGTVKWFDPTRGYGFIAEDDGGEVFLHASGILTADASSFREGTPVEYELEHTGRGMQAVDVVPLA